MNIQNFESKKIRKSASLGNALFQSHINISRVVTEGSIAIDATTGNGNDTVFLANLVGNSGKVYAFDIQEKALETTKNKLIEKGYSDRVILIKDSHENIDKYVQNEVSAVMFNLGYLPGGNHFISTNYKSTLTAVKKAMNLLKVNGIISIVIYYGKDSGYFEKEELLEYIAKINFRQFSVMKTEFVNQINCPPILICIERIA